MALISRKADRPSARLLAIYMLGKGYDRRSLTAPRTSPGGGKGARDAILHRPYFALYDARPISKSTFRKLIAQASYKALRILFPK